MYANPAAVDLFSAADSDELRDRPLTDLVEPTADGGVETVERVVEDDQTAGQARRMIRTLAGNSVQASITACDVTWDGDDGTVSVISDRSDTDEREHRLEALHEATRHLMAAEVHNEVAGIGVNAAAEIIGLDANAVHLINDDGQLEPVAATASARELVGDIPTFEQGDSIAWRVYERGEATAVPDVRLEEDVQNPETPTQQYAETGEHGVLVAASAGTTVGGAGIVRWTGPRGRRGGGPRRRRIADKAP